MNARTLVVLGFTAAGLSACTHPTIRESVLSPSAPASTVSDLPVHRNLQLSPSSSLIVDPCASMPGQTATSTMSGNIKPGLAPCVLVGPSAAPAAANAPQQKFILGQQTPNVRVAVEDGLNVFANGILRRISVAGTYVDETGLMVFEKIRWTKNSLARAWSAERHDASGKRRTVPLFQAVQLEEDKRSPNQERQFAPAITGGPRVPLALALPNNPEYGFK